MTTFGDSFDNVWEIDPDTAVGAGMVSVFGVLLVVFLIAGFISIALYIAKAIPIYLLSKKAGRKYPWLAFIPIAQGYALATIGEGPVTVPVIKKTIEGRGNAFWISFLIPIAASFIEGFLAVLAFIPFIGLLFSLLILLVTVAVALVNALFLYAFYLDIFRLFQPENTNNTAFAVLCAVCSSIGLDIVSTIFLYTLLKKEPVFTSAENETVIIG